MLMESALTSAAPSATVTPVYLSLTPRRLRPLTGKLLDEMTKSVRAELPKQNDLDDQWEIAEGGASWGA